MREKADQAGYVEDGKEMRIGRGKSNDRMKEESMFMLALRIIKILKR